ncbi:DUF1501 domain-containing protein [bacterium]|nr:DUF1501 domain-containing protein [bacterium]
MKPIENSCRATRRDFLRQSACAALGVTGLVNALGHLRLMTAAMAQSGPAPGYKALVCLFLNGGNDANNLLVPAGDRTNSPLRADYENGRGVLALPSTSLHPLVVPPGTRAFARHHGDIVQPLGVHPSGQALADLFNAGKLAFVCNVGTLAYPIPSRQAYLADTIPLPLQMGSHADQQVQWQSSLPDRPFLSGWGGRAADLLHTSYNDPGASKVSMSISLDGINSFQVGTTGDVVQYVVRPGTGSVPLDGFDSVAGDNDLYDFARNPDGSYKSNDAGIRLKGFEDIMRLTHGNLHEEAYNRVVARSRATEGTIGAALTAAAASGVDFDALFANASGPLGDQLKTIAKFIASRAILGNNRQIFFCQISGYDTHDALLSCHANLINELSRGLRAFHDALLALGVLSEVTTFTASDFNRTFRANSANPDTAGADHAWGGHTMVMGGAVRGGEIYGHFPPLKIGAAEGSIDTKWSSGEWIPDTAVDQYSAVLTAWMGAGGSELEAIFPNLPRFDDPLSVASANLGFL